MSVFEKNRVDVHLLLQLDAATHRIYLPRTMGQRIWAGLIAELLADDVSVRREASCARLTRTDLTPKDAAFAYARGWNRLIDLFLRGLIADAVLYTSDDGPITGKRVFLEHQRKRMQLFWQCKLPVFAEIGAIRVPGKAPEPCVIIAYGSKDSLAGVVRLQT